jgi:hypothetical protein
MSDIYTPGRTNATASVEILTIRTTSQTVEVPASTTDDSSDDGVAIQERQPVLIHTANSPERRGAVPPHPPPLGLEQKGRQEYEGQRDSHRDSLHSKGQGIQFRSDSNQTRGSEGNFHTPQWRTSSS